MNKLLKLDWILIIAVFLLLIISLLILYSISFSNPETNFTNFNKQLVSIIIGVSLMFFLSFFNYRKFDSYSTKAYFLILLLLLAVIFFGKTVRGNTGWLGIGELRLQPVEIVKVVMVIFLASFLSKKKTKLSILARTTGSIVLVLIPVFLVLKQPDLGSSVIILASWATMLALSGLTKRNLAFLFIVGALALSPGWFLMKDYQKDRLINFVNPQHDPTGSGYNVNQSIIAVGSGQLFGKGLGQGSQSQLNFLPEKHTDFILAVIAEEIGLLGITSVVVIFLVIFWRMKNIAQKARDNFGHLLVIGFMAMFFFQLFINAGMNVGIVPVTGVPLPFLSYGGSSMVMMLASIGIVQSVYLKRVRAEFNNLTQHLSFDKIPHKE